MSHTTFMQQLQHGRMVIGLYGIKHPARKSIDKIAGSCTVDLGVDAINRFNRVSRRQQILNIFVFIHTAIISKAPKVIDLQLQHR